MASRRLGPRDSDTSNAILDATERLMREQGYSAVSSRRVAEAAGIKQGLVYYYFQTMDELLLETFRRRTSGALARLKAKVRSERPVQAIWEDLTHTVDSRLSYEFNALASRHPGIREEVNRYLVSARRLQAEAIAREAKERGIDLGPATPAAIAFLMYSASMTIVREASSGVTEAHADVLALFEALLARFA